MSTAGTTVAATPARTRPRFRVPVPLVVAASVALVCVLEFLLFDSFGSPRVTGIYPRWNDQIQYLSEAYTGHEYARTHGLAAGLWKTLVNPSAQGTLHDFGATLLFALVGPSRSAALALNMLALIAWQLALFLAVSRRARSPVLALAAAMLPLALRGPWLIAPGSAYDFRLDHFAMCALGVTSAAALLTDGFRRRTGSIAFGVAVGLTLLTRFITGTYLVLIFLVLLAWCAAGAERGKRAINLAWAGLIAAAMAGPIFWLNREWVWNYYYIGHYVGPESAIRNQNFGLLRSSQFVWGWLGERHLGIFFGVLAVAVALALGLVRLVTRRPGRAGTEGSQASRRLFDVSDIFVCGATFLLCPALVLTLHPQKSDVVLGALAPGVVLIVTALWLVIARGLATPPAAYVQTIIATAAILVTLAGFAVRQLVPGEDPAVVANLRQVNSAADYIFTHGEAAGLERPRIAVDYITDALDAQVLRVVCYERHHVWKDFDMRLPTGIAEPDAALVRERIADSDFVFLLADDQPFGGFPYDRKLLQMRPELRAWCDAHLRPALHFTFWGHPITLYERVREGGTKAK